MPNGKSYKIADWLSKIDANGQRITDMETKLYSAKEYVSPRIHSRVREQIAFRVEHQLTLENELRRIR